MKLAKPTSVPIQKKVSHAPLFSMTSLQLIRLPINIRDTANRATAVASKPVKEAVAQSTSDVTKMHDSRISGFENWPIFVNSSAAKVFASGV